MKGRDFIVPASALTELHPAVRDRRARKFLAQYHRPFVGHCAFLFFFFFSFSSTEPALSFFPSPESGGAVFYFLCLWEERAKKGMNGQDLAPSGWTLALRRGRRPPRRAERRREGGGGSDRSANSRRSRDACVPLARGSDTRSGSVSFSVRVLIGPRTGRAWLTLPLARSGRLPSPPHSRQKCFAPNPSQQTLSKAS